MKKLLFLALFTAYASAFEMPNILSITIPKQADSAKNVLDSAKDSIDSAKKSIDSAGLDSEKKILDSVKNILDSVKIPDSAKGAESSVKIPAMDLKVGESGIVTRTINDNEFIIANALVSEIKDGNAVVEISEFTQMNEKYLPKPLGKVAQGDKITFRILYDKALLIAPNQSAYQAIVDRFSDIDFLHSDIFATYLAKEGENMPSIADFGKFCAKFDIGLVFVAGQKTLDILNCQSFKILDSSPLNLSDESVIAPFFTRISKESIDNIFSVKKFEPYFAYFENLIQSKNTRTLGENAESSAESNTEQNAESSAESNTKQNAESSAKTE